MADDRDRAIRDYAVLIPQAINPGIVRIAVANLITSIPVETIWILISILLVVSTCILTPIAIEIAHTTYPFFISIRSYLETLRRLHINKKLKYISNTCKQGTN